MSVSVRGVTDAAPVFSFPAAGGVSPSPPQPPVPWSGSGPPPAGWSGSGPGGVPWSPSGPPSVPWSP